MSETDTAAKVCDALKAAGREPAATALPILNGLAVLMRGDVDQPLEIEEARSSAFIAICEVGKALHRGTPADHLWAPAIDAAMRWHALAAAAAATQPFTSPR